MDPTPSIKYEHSPVDSIADSFVSTPGTQYPSLFGQVDAHEAMSPQSLIDVDVDVDVDVMFGSVEPGTVGLSHTPTSSIASTPAPEKKPVKKRKSWGQQLPEPKTNLPPRKRAKTEDEKEQRRVERVLRNRRAAQSSRERKRQEVEALEAEKRAIERRNQDLEMRLADMEAKFHFAQEQIKQLTGGASDGTVKIFRSSSVASSPQRVEPFRQSSPVTFSKELFTSQDSENHLSISQQPLAELHQPTPRTVNPASLSPEMRPVAESSTNASSSDVTQHPAAVLCDLQCPSQEQRPWTSSRAPFHPLLTMMTCMTMALTSISTFLFPLSQILTCLSTGSSLSPTPSILTLIIWLVTTTASLTTSPPSTNSPTMTRSHSQRPKFSLRIQLLRRLLSSSPCLARPLKDATMEAMRLASTQQLARDCMNGVTVCERSDVGMPPPSLESLMTLHWAIQVIEREQARTPNPDAGADVSVPVESLFDLLTARDVKGRRGVTFGSRARGVDTIGQKSLDGWRTEF